MRVTPSILVLVCANLLPVVGVVWWGWSVFSVMLLFWLENMIVGILNIPRILFARGDGDEKRGRLFSRLFTAVFFSVHYGMFTFAHGVFVFSLFGEGIGEDPSPQLVYQLVLEYQLYWAVLALFVSHLMSLVLNYFLSGEYRTATVKKMMHKPYSRIVVLHLGIIFGGIVLDLLQAPVFGLIVLIVVKIVVDVRAHMKEHHELSVTISPDQEPA